MEYRRFENTVIVRMDRNEDLFAELKTVSYTHLTLPTIA